MMLNQMYFGLLGSTYEKGSDIWNLEPNLLLLLASSFDLSMTN